MLSAVGARGPGEAVVRCGERSRSRVDVGLREAASRRSSCDALARVGGENDVDAIMAGRVPSVSAGVLLAADATPTPTRAEGTDLAGAAETVRLRC